MSLTPNIHIFTLISFHVRREQNWNFRLSNKFYTINILQRLDPSLSRSNLNFLMSRRRRRLLAINDNVLLEKDLFSRTFEYTKIQTILWHINLAWLAECLQICKLPVKVNSYFFASGNWKMF